MHRPKAAQEFTVAENRTFIDPFDDHVSKQDKEQ